MSAYSNIIKHRAIQQTNMNRLFAAFDAAATNILDPSTLFVCGSSSGTTNAVIDDLDFDASSDGTYATYDNADENTFDGMYATYDNDDGENSTHQGQSLGDSDSHIDNGDVIVIRDFCIEQDHMNGLRLIKAETMTIATVTSVTTATSASTSWSRTTGTFSDDDMHDSLGEHYQNRRKNKDENTIGYYCYDDDDDDNNNSNDHKNLMPALKRELPSFGKSREFRSFDRRTTNTTTTGNNNTVQQNGLRPSFVMRTNNNEDDIDQQPQLVSLDEENKHYEYLTIYTSSSSTSTEIDTIDSTPTSPSPSLHAHETTLSNHNRQIQQQQQSPVATMRSHKELTAMLCTQNNNHNHNNDNDNKTTAKSSAVVQQSSPTHNRPSFKRLFRKRPPFLSLKKSYEHIDE